MPENRLIKYYYKNRKLSGAAVGHIFKYLSAVSGCKFIEDKESAIIWCDDQGNLPASVEIVLGRKDDYSDSSFEATRSKKDLLFLFPDPVEKIYEKISLKITLGPYSDVRHKPDNRLDESLGGIILGLFEKLRNAGVAKAPMDTLSLWPGEHKFALALTHDVDIIRRSVRGSVRLLFKKDVPGGFQGLFDSMVSLLKRSRNSYDKVQEWIDGENKHGIKSTIFVFPGNRKNPDDPKYRLNRLKDSLNYIKQNGFETALHTGIECHRGDNMDESMSLLNRAGDFSVAGIRPHYLSASLPGYWRRAAELDFIYSSCLGFDEEVGFCQGIDLPFIPFDAENDAPLDIVEIPIGIMDCGLINNSYGNIDESLNMGKKIVDRVKRTGGILVLDWHQRTMYNTDYPGWAKTCFDLIDYAREEGAFLTTMEGISKLLRNRMAERS